jgi:hypothetical protein
MALNILVFSLAFHLRILQKNACFQFLSINMSLLFPVKKTILIFPDFLFAVCMVSLRRNE